MFSLIITIISIALVAALALATLYYGGNAFNVGSADAKATEILNQGQQILGASDLYFSQFGTYPTVEELVANEYLKTIPVARTAVGESQAAGAEWTSPVAGQPVYVLPGVSSDVCASVNFKAYGVRGALAALRMAYASQCYGPTTADLKVVISKSGTAMTAALPANVTSDPLPDVADAPSWTVPPGQAVAEGAGGNGAGGNGVRDTPIAEIAEGTIVARTQFSFNVVNPNQLNQTVSVSNVLVDTEFNAMNLNELGKVVTSGNPYNISAISMSVGGNPFFPNTSTATSASPFTVDFSGGWGRFDTGGAAVTIGGGVLDRGATRVPGDSDYSFSPLNIGDVQRTDFVSWTTTDSFITYPEINLAFAVEPDSVRSTAITYLPHDGTNSGTWCLTWRKGYAFSTLNAFYEVASNSPGACQ